MDKRVHVEESLRRSSPGSGARLPRSDAVCRSPGQSPRPHHTGTRATHGSRTPRASSYTRAAAPGPGPVSFAGCFVLRAKGCGPATRRGGGGSRPDSTAPSAAPHPAPSLISNYSRPRLAITTAVLRRTTKSLGGRAKTGARYRVAWRPRSLERLCKPVSPA